MVARLAQVRGLHTALIDDDPEVVDAERSIWMLVASDPEALQREPVRSVATQSEPAADVEPWTDDFNNLFSVLR